MLDFDLIRVTKVKYGLTELVPHLLQQIQVEVIVCKFPLVRPAERALQREGIRDVHLFPHHHTRCGLLGFLH